MDFIKEEIVTRGNDAARKALVIVLALIMASFGLFFIWALFTFVGTVMSDKIALPFKMILAASAAVSGGVVFGAWKMIGLVRTEYEYCFVNGELDIDSVVNNNKRTALRSIKLKDVERAAPISDESYARLASMPGVVIKKYAFARDESLYFLFFLQGGQRHMVLIQPSAEMRAMFKQYNPRNVVA